jgi:hypothetical protein
MNGECRREERKKSIFFTRTFSRQIIIMPKKGKTHKHKKNLPKKKKEKQKFLLCLSLCI